MLKMFVKKNLMKTACIQETGKRLELTKGEELLGGKKLTHKRKNKLQHDE